VFEGECDNLPESQFIAGERRKESKYAPGASLRPTAMRRVVVLQRLLAVALTQRLALKKMNGQRDVPVRLAL